MLVVCSLWEGCSGVFFASAGGWSVGLFSGWVRTSRSVLLYAVGGCCFVCYVALEPLLYGHGSFGPLVNARNDDYSFFEAVGG